jgi:hypothetical protein
MKNWVRLTIWAANIRRTLIMIVHLGPERRRTSLGSPSLLIAIIRSKFSISVLSKRSCSMSLFAISSILLQSSTVKTINFVHDAGQINQTCRRIHYWVSICNNAACNTPLSNTVTRALFASEPRALISPLWRLISLFAVQTRFFKVTCDGEICRYEVANLLEAPVVAACHGGSTALTSGTPESLHISMCKYSHPTTLIAG